MRNFAHQAILIVLIAAGGTTGLAGTTQTERLVRELGLTQAEALAYQALWVMSPESLPERIRGHVSVPLKGTTPLLFELRRHWRQVPPDLQRSLHVLFDRPSKDLLPNSLVSPGGHFRVHYTLSGPHATTETFARIVGEVFEHCWSVEVDQLGFRAPPEDFGVDGPEYDVYVMNINDYGYTTADREIPETSADDWTSFIVVDNDFANTRYHTKGIPALKVTAAHEFFHAIHFGYRSYRDDDVFYYEASSVWMEDYVYDDVNDYYQYLPEFFRHPDKPFDTYDGWHEYGLGLWNKMLVRLFGVDVIRQIWEQMLEQSAVEAMDTVLRNHGDSFERALAEFSAWTYFTGARADTVQFFRDGVDYPDLHFNREFETDTSLVVSDSVRRLAGTFLHFRVNEPGRWVASLDYDLPTAWVCGIAVWDASGEHWIDTPLSARDIDLGELSSGSTFLIVPLNVVKNQSWPDERQRFRLQVELRPLANLPPFRVFDAAPNPYCPREHGFVSVQFVLSKTGKVTVRVVDQHGRVVRTDELGVQPAGLRRIYRWDGRNDRGEPVASGVYLVEIVSEGRARLTKVAVVR